MTSPRRKSPPTGLGTAGRRLWRSVAEAYELRVDEWILLESACRTLDFLSRIDAELVGAPLTVKGSMGQDREHPLLSEARQQRSTLARLLAQLKLPDAAFDAGGLSRSGQARAAAQSRWSQAWAK